MVTSQKLGASVSKVVEVLADTPLLRLKKSVSLGLPFRIGGAGNHLTPCHTFLQDCEITEKWGWHYPTLIASRGETPASGEGSPWVEGQGHIAHLWYRTYACEFWTPGNVKKHYFEVFGLKIMRFISLQVFLIYNTLPWLKIQKDIKGEAFLPTLFYTNRQ